MKGSGNKNPNDPWGPFRVIFSKPDGINEFLKDQAKINGLVVKAFVDEEPALLGRWLRHNVLMSKNAKVGCGLRQMLMKMSIDCRIEMAMEVFQADAAEFLALDDTSLGKRAKQVFDKLTIGHAEQLASRFLRECLEEQVPIAAPSH